VSDSQNNYSLQSSVDDIHRFNLDLPANQIYLVGSEDYISHETPEEPGVEFSMASRFIKNLNIIRARNEDPILIHMKTCFSRKTPITTAKGLKPIKDIQVGEFVLTHTGKYQPVIDVMSQMYEGDMIRLYYGRKGNNDTSITATSDHPVRVEREGVRTWIPMSEVVCGDIIFVEASLCEHTGERIPWWKRIKNYNAERLRRKPNTQTKKIEERILQECQRLTQEGWRVVPVDTSVKPDIVGFKDGKIVVFEVENMKGKSLEVKKEKYNGAAINDYVDDVIWITPNTKAHYSWYEIDDQTPFVKVKITGTKKWSNKYAQRVYNLTVAEDNSYVANRVVVHNCGGFWEEGMAIYDAIVACPNKVTVLNYMHARSMSSIIFQAADKRVMMPHSTFMFHEGSIEFSGTPKMFRTTHEQELIALKIMIGIYIDAMKKKGKLRKKSRKEIENWLVGQMDKKEDVFLSAKEAVAYGFADEIFGKNGKYDWKKLTEH
jgi:ATP-dependent protease ClpP protease subunit